MPHLRFLLALLLLAILAPPLLAQQAPTQPVRLELPYKPEEVDVEVIALPDSSLLVYHKAGNLWGTDATFHFTKYNSQLEEVWTDTVNIAPDNEYLRHYILGPYTYLIFGGENLRDYTFVRLNHQTGDTWHKQLEVEALDAVYEFAVLQENYFLIGRSSKDGKPLLVHLNPATGEVTPLPSLQGGQSYFSDLLADNEQQHVDVVISESNGRVARLQAKRFDKNGRQLSSNFILQKEDKNLLNAELTPGDTSQRLLIGTYGTRDLRFSRGFFVRPLNAGPEEGSYYSLLQLRNFFKYMKPQREERTRRREEARLRTGRGSGGNFRLLLHDLLVTPTGYILAAEVYYPQVSSNSRNPRFEPFIALPRQDQGYKRSHAVALGFDRNGLLLWDNIMPLAGITTPYLTHVVEVQQLPDGRLVMAYPENGKIMYQLIDEDRFVEEKLELELLPYGENEKIQSTEYPGLIRWYGNSMAAFGFQRVRSKGAETRQVFYINKITFQ